MPISSKLRVVMAIKGLNINELCKLTGLSQPTISKLYNNNIDSVKGVKLETIEVICKALDVQPEDIIEYVSE